MNILGNIMLMEVEKTNSYNFNVEVMGAWEKEEQIYNCTKIIDKTERINYFYKLLEKMKAKLMMMFQLVIRFENQN